MPRRPQCDHAHAVTGACRHAMRRTENHSQEKRWVPGLRQPRPRWHVDLLSHINSQPMHGCSTEQCVHSREGGWENKSKQRRWPVPALPAALCFCCCKTAENKKSKTTVHMPLKTISASHSTFIMSHECRPTDPKLKPLETNAQRLSMRKSLFCVRLHAHASRPPTHTAHALCVWGQPVSLRMPG